MSEEITIRLTAWGEDVDVYVSDARVPYVYSIEIFDGVVTIKQVLNGDIPGVEYWAPDHAVAVDESRISQYRTIHSPVLKSVKFAMLPPPSCAPWQSGQFEVACVPIDEVRRHG